MIVDVVTNKISLKVLPEEYYLIYTLEPHEIPYKDNLIVLFNSLLTFELKVNCRFQTSILDFFILRDILKNKNFNIELKLTEQCFEICSQYLTERKEIEDIKDGLFSQDITTNLKNKPYEDQIYAIKFMLKRQKALNACSVGIGKTLTALACFDILKTQNKVYNGLIYCLNENKLTWKNEIIKHTDYTYRIVGNGTKIVLDDIEKFKEDFLVIHYDAIINQEVKEALMHKKFNFAIYDEAHIFRNLTTKRSEAVFDIIESTDPKYRFALTGTPVAQCPLEAYSIVKLIRPTILPSHSRFKKHFCKEILIKPKKSRRKIPIIVDYYNLDQLKYMVDLYTFRKTQDDVKGFPPTVCSIKELEMEADQKELYEHIRAETFEAIASMPEKALNLDHILTKILRLRQVLSHPAILGEYKTSSIKFTYLDQLLEEILTDQNQKVVIWSCFKDTLNLLEQKYKKQYGALLFTGDVTNEQRDIHVTKFTNEKKSRMLCGITSLGTGGNFQAARTAIYIDEPLKILELRQSRGRITRRDAVGTSHLVSLICKDTVDDRFVRKLIARKEAIIDQVIDPDNQMVRKDELLDGLSKI